MKRKRNLNPTTLAECWPGDIVLILAKVTNEHLALVRLVDNDGNEIDDGPITVNRETKCKVGGL